MRGCTSWSKTIATPLIPAVKVRAKALSMGSFPKSAPMFHWLFAWAKFSTRRNRMETHLSRIHKHTFHWNTPCSPPNLKKISSTDVLVISLCILHCHICSAMIVKQACKSGGGLTISSKLQTNRSSTLHPSKKWGPLWTAHGTGWTAQSAENWCPRNGTLPKTHKMQETHFGAGSERDCTNVGGI